MRAIEFFERATALAPGYARAYAGLADAYAVAAFYAAGCLVMENGSPRMLANGTPDVRIMFMPASECSIVDRCEYTTPLGLPVVPDV